MKVSGSDPAAAKRRFSAVAIREIDVESDQRPPGCTRFQNRLRVTTGAERAVDRDIAGHRLQDSRELPRP